MKLNEVTEIKAGDLDKVKNYTHGNLNIQDENLTSLEGCPEKVTGDFFCFTNNLTSLEYCPKEVDGIFVCHQNKITSLEGCQKEMKIFICAENELVSLEGGPEKIYVDFNCSHNQITSFEHFPKYIGRDCQIGSNKFTSFKDIDQHIEYIGDSLFANEMNIISGYSDLFGINGLQKILIGNKEIKDIVNKYLPEKDLINFQDEMIKLGYESYL